ncbi:MAG: hypothetical protein B6I29_02010 [Marinitoga sp. 4572_148]|nr:MAG: hypothetical protein B6I29_02010 [Marinitoga sp. 4572_148]
MKVYSIILIFSLIIVGIVFNLFMINYIYENYVLYRDNIFKEELNLINETEKMYKNKEYSKSIIYATDSATLIKIRFNNSIEGVIIQEE